MDAKKIKEAAVLAAKIIGVILGWLIVIQLLIAFMWECHDMGIPM